MNQRCDDTRSGTTDWMTECDRATVHVQAFRVDRQLSHTCDDLRSEGFVQFDKAETAQLHSCLCEQLPDRRNRADTHDLRIDSCYRVIDDPRQRLEVSRTTLGFRYQHERRSTV